MAHYAFLDENNIVTEVIVGRHEWEVVGGVSDWEKYYGEKRNQRCIRTSYNGNIRGTFAGIGSRYDEELDIFIPVKPYGSWIWDSEQNVWVAPVSVPDSENPWYWDEDTVSWILATELLEDVPDNFVD